MALAENRLKQSILSYLRTLGHDVWNTNQGRIRGKYKVARDGLPDIQGYHCRNGLAIFIEAKIPPNKLSSEQTCFIFNAQKAGCIALKAESLADVLRERRLQC